MIYSFSVSHKILYKGVFITKPAKSVFFSSHRLFVDAKKSIYLLLNKLNNELRDCNTIMMHFCLVSIFHISQPRVLK